MRDECSKHGVQHALRGQAACKVERGFVCSVALQACGDQGAAWAAKVLNDIKIWPLVQPRDGRPGKHHHLVQRVHSQLVLGRQNFMRRWSNNVREKEIEEFGKYNRFLVPRRRKDATAHGLSCWMEVCRGVSP